MIVYSKQNNYRCLNSGYYKKNNCMTTSANLGNNSVIAYNLPYKPQVSFGKKLCIHKCSLDNFEGCIFGIAIGDAFGAPVEFLKLNKIKNLYGDNGLTYLITNSKNIANFTDDTQLTIFTADGLLKSATRHFGFNSMPNLKVVFDAYRDWYKMCAEGKKIKKGWISSWTDIISTGGSGKTCMSTLSKNQIGSSKYPLNNASTSGGVMRVAPVGLMYYKNPESAFKIAMECAATTHGGAEGYLPAGMYASIISYLIRGESLEAAIDKSAKILKTYKGYETLLQKINEAKKLVEDTNLKPSDAIKMLGKGWNGSEALSIAIYCALKNSNNYKQAIIDAVNHNGDSDTVGAITGGIIGTSLGLKKIPQELKDVIQLRNQLRELSKDLYLGGKHIKHSKYKYPVDLGNIESSYYMKGTFNNVSVCK